jgi:hypothetical protein
MRRAVVRECSERRGELQGSPGRASSLLFCSEPEPIGGTSSNEILPARRPSTSTPTSLGYLHFTWHVIWYNARARVIACAALLIHVSGQVLLTNLRFPLPIRAP